MRIASLRIENYRNIRFAEAQSLPDFIVVGGINGCGKSAILEAIYMAKEAAGLEARNPAQGKNVISSDQNSAHVILEIQLDPKDRAFVSQHLEDDCPETARLDVTFFRGSRFPIVRCPRPVRWLLQSLAIGLPDAPGYFDYFDAHRRIQPQALASINAVLTPDQWRSLLAAGDSKFNFGKQYLVALKLRELQRFQRLTSQGAPYSPGPFKEIQDFFDDFFAPMRFVDIDLDSNPFRFTVRTPNGEIDIDDLSSGERQIFNTYLHFHQLNPRGSIILFDEPDIHLHPDFARRYLGVLQEVGSSNQFWITTHSADMMLSVEIDKLYTVTKAPVEKRNSQFFRVVDDVSRYNLIAEIMGSTGLIGINEKVVFIEGDQASLDVAVYETFFPPSRYDVFVPSSTKGTVKAIADRVNELLSSAVGFSEYYCIVDGDADVDGVEFGGGRIYTLPAYHVENYLLDEALILRATRTLLRERTPYANVGEIAEALSRLVMSDSHVNSVARSLFNTKLRGFSKRATEELRTRKRVSAMEVDFGDVRREAEAYLRAALDEASWKRKAIGRVLLRAYCGEIRVKYLQFRNLLLDSASDAPADLQGIMQQIGIRRKQLVERPPGEQRQAQPSDSAPVLSAAEGVTIIPKEFKEEGELRIGSLQLGEYTIILDYEQERIEGPEGSERSDIWKRFLRLMRTERGRALWNSQHGEEADEFRDARRAELLELLGLPTE